MAWLITDGKLLGNTSGLKIMRERTNHSTQAPYLSAEYSDLYMKLCIKFKVRGAKTL